MTPVEEVLVIIVECDKEWVISKDMGAKKRTPELTRAVRDGYLERRLIHMHAGFKKFEYRLTPEGRKAADALMAAGMTIE